MKNKMNNPKEERKIETDQPSISNGIFVVASFSSIILEQNEMIYQKKNPWNFSYLDIHFFY